VAPVGPVDRADPTVGPAEERPHPGPLEIVASAIGDELVWPPTRRRPSPEDPAGPPVVHVTIGRVEVRASPATPPPESVPAPEPVPSHLSLDDYLERRKATWK
jgi:hypothetical protein